ncbi:hypothetical protein JCM3775_006592 [Rhodotorula graminis]
MHRTSFVSRSTLFALAFAIIALLGLAASPAQAQETTLTQEDNGQVVTTSIQPTLWTTDSQVMTWTPSTPATPTPRFSTGRILKVAEYITTQSTGTVGMDPTGLPPIKAAYAASGGGPCVQLGSAAAVAVAMGASGALWVLF